MKPVSCHDHLWALAAAIVLLMAAALSPVSAQSAAQAATAATIDHGGPPKSFTAKAIDKVKEVAKSAGDIFSRVPCCRRRAAPGRWARCRMWRESLPWASPS